ncbi:fructosyl amine:oxygen oxidoreductase [Talaromyces stipitatus ATCC 10500]|uniref:Fructosyl amine:oxygen oxidoreductase n=1 Tax=Talaromyces stipitatus (strain ATCC 10500 / CBS 375.48 / QM 6759 / NRRL 1006) TaxID=441959 RepID=B8M4R3_TALSN|nr:fructosyl amine:oxygen oxidoreductase [Talaromyces stipitatus ATCC 10500]EED19258.1 fructosyl amine:oxygen oxidoreductase [Talaromyces stipitatus ATCC 10500]
MKQLTHDSTILLVGGGTWGCSTALELARRGYKNITVLDSSPIPSPISAGNDVNKIMEEGFPSSTDSDEDYVWNRMHQLATNKWKRDSVYRPFYHPTGFVMAASQDDARHEVDSYIKSCQHKVRLLSTPEEFRSTMPEGILIGDFPGWKGFFQETGAGWVFARGALEAAYHEATRLGVQFVTGESKGKVARLLYDSENVIGAQTVDGTKHRADQTILCAGANSDQLFDFERQLRPTAWTLAHIQMTDEERKLWKDLPVLFNVNSGFFMEPDAQKGELKFVDEHPGYCNFIKDPETGEEMSIPFAKHQIPIQSEQKAREFLRQTVPQIADRPFSFARICWDADTPDRVFLIDHHPKYKSLVLAVGGSGDGFMMMPAVGVAIADELEGILELKLKKGFRWRPETAVGRNWRDTQNRWGGGGDVRDFQKVDEWTHIRESVAA